MSTKFPKAELRNTQPKMRERKIWLFSASLWNEKSLKTFAFIMWVFALGIFVVPASSLYAQTPFQIGVSPFPPYVTVLEDEKISGIATDIVMEALNTVNISKYEIKEYPWARALLLLNRGQIQALYTIGKTPEREATFYYPDEPLFYTKWVFFIRKADKGTLKFNSLDDLKGRNIAVIRGYKYTPAFWEFLNKEKKYEELSHEEQSFLMLMAGRVDYVITEYAAGITVAKQLGMEDQIAALMDHPLEEIPVYIAFNKKSVTKEFVDKFSKALKEIKAQKVHMEIFDKTIKK